MMNLREFDLKTTISILSQFGYDPEEAFKIYAIIVGIPSFIWSSEERKTVEEKIHELFLEPYAPLRNEVKSALIFELGREHRGYFSLLEALASGMKSFSELSDLPRMEPTTISKYLIELEKEYGFVISVKPVGMRKSKNTKYKLASNLFDFYFSMIKPILSTAEFSPNKALNIILDKFPQYTGLKLEEICTNFLRENHDILGFEPLEIGKSWGKVPGKKNESFDLEIVSRTMKPNFDTKTSILRT